MLDIIKDILGIINKNGTDQLAIILLIVVVSGAIYYLYTEKNKAEQKVDVALKEKDDSFKERESLYKEMLEMSGDYHEQVVNLHRESNSTLTSLITMFNLIKDNKKD